MANHMKGNAGPAKPAIYGSGTATGQPTQQTTRAGEVARLTADKPAAKMKSTFDPMLPNELLKISFNAITDDWEKRLFVAKYGSHINSVSGRPLVESIVLAAALLDTVV